MEDKTGLSEEDRKLIDDIYTEENIFKDGEKRSTVEKIVYYVESYINEIGSGEDFIQWFNYSNTKDIGKLQEALREIGADESLKICTEALSVAYPNGIPDGDEELEELTMKLEFEDDFESEREIIEGLALKQLDEADVLETKLAVWIKRNVIT